MPRPSSHTLVTVLVAVILLLGAASLGAYAADGLPLLLGKKNVATQPTKLTATGSGPALALRSRPNRPALQVSNSQRIDNLNADLVDGIDTGDLITVPRVFIFSGTDEVLVDDELRWNVPIAPGTYEMAFNAGIGVPDVVNGTVLCGFGERRTGEFFALASAPEKDDQRAWLASQSVQDIRPGRRIDFFCNTSGNQISIDSVIGIQVIATPINGFSRFKLGAPTRASTRAER